MLRAGSGMPIGVNLLPLSSTTLAHLYSLKPALAVCGSTHTRVKILGNHRCLFVSARKDEPQHLPGTAALENLKLFEHIRLLPAEKCQGVPCPPMGQAH